MRDLIVTENISLDGVIDLSQGWFDPQTQGDSDHSDLMVVLTEQGQVRPHVNVFVNSQVVRRDQVLQVPISGDTEICIMPAVSGG